MAKGDTNKAVARDVQDMGRSLGSSFMRYGVTSVTMNQMTVFAEAWASLSKPARAELYTMGIIPADKKASTVSKPTTTVVAPPAASGTIGPIVAKGGKSIGSMQGPGAGAPVSCSCGWWAFNDPIVKGEKHTAKKAKKGETHNVTHR